MRQSTKWTLRLAAIPAGLLGVAFAVFVITGAIGIVRSGSRAYDDASALNRHGRTAVATVISKRVRGDEPIATDIKPMKVRFTAADGTEHVVGVDGDHHVGARIRVRYDPADPDVAVTESLTKRHFYAVWKMVGGVVLALCPLFIAAGAVAYVIDRRMSRRTAPAS
ncbi:DUF3592 domain-containing protein [Actinoallomurus sp. NPDC050550]|uniref:DUF3592 domain-containing protein n=1 Tax=Actinoallomurus sp. NPDC050550 TaxID=3154937 RepID=UPI0033E65B01